MSHLRNALLCATLVACSPWAWSAGLPTGTLAFSEPTGVAGPNDVINVKAIFTLDTSSISLPFGSYGTLDISSLDPAELPAQGAKEGESYATHDFAEYTSVGLTYGYNCVGSFFAPSSCSSPHYISSFPGADAGVVTPFNADVLLNAGESIEFTMARFTPLAPGAAPGIYTLGNVMIGLSFVGRDAEGNEITSSVVLGETCADFSPSCTFSRTVVSQVPEPSAYALVASALGVLLALAGRRARQIVHDSTDRSTPDTRS